MNDITRITHDRHVPEKRLRRHWLPLIISFFLMLPFAAQAKDGGIESLKQTSKAFAEVAKKVSPTMKTSSRRTSPSIRAIPAARW